MARIILVNRFYAPDQTATAQLLADLAEDLAAAGHRVTVIASRPPGAVQAEKVHGVCVIRTGSRRRHATSLFAKALDFARFHVAAIIALLREVRRGDVLVSLTDPPLIGVTAAAVAAIKRARLVHWVHDIYPEVAVAVSGIRLLRAWGPLRNAAWRSAVCCVTLGATMERVLARAGVVHTAVVPNWAPRGLHPTSPGDPATAELRRDWGIDGKFVVLYSGNLGRVHDLAPVLAAAEHLRGDPSVVFVLVGSGAQLEALELSARNRRLGNVLFRPLQPRLELSHSLAVGDVHLVSLRPCCDSYVFPSKLYGAAAVGRPVIFIGADHSDVAQIIVRGQFGLTIAPDAPAALAQAIRQLAASPATLTRMREAALEFGRAHDSSIALSKWRALIEQFTALETAKTQPAST